MEGGGEGGGKEAVRAALGELALGKGKGRSGSLAEEEAAHAFWDTQPVPGMADDLEALPSTQMGPIDAPVPEKVRRTPYGLPASFQWADIDLDSAEQAHELYSLLHENYVEDGDNMFRFDYSVRRP